MKKLFVIFGGTGDLSKRYLIPAVAELNSQLSPDHHIHTLIIGRRDWSQKDFQDFLTQSSDHLDLGLFSYLKMNITEARSYTQLKDYISEFTGDIVENIVFYLSVGPDFFESVTHHLATVGLHKSQTWWDRKLVIEKPFGKDLRSATLLNMRIQEHFKESQIYRVDHYLGKNFVSELQNFRLQHEQEWSDNHIKCIEILANESLTILDRWAYYDKSGAIRDMIQNHLLQILAITTMRHPHTMDPEDIRDRKMQALHDVSPFLIDPRHDIILGQYEWYRSTEGVSDHSSTETFTRIHLHIDNPIWKDTDVYLQTGKWLDSKQTQVNIEFVSWEKISFGETPENKNNSYSRLIENIFNGNQTLFVRWDSLKAAWQIVNELVHCKDNCPLVYNYAIWSHGPKINLNT